ncbi:hypothetical protein AMK59_4127, partial [Oryctes borbonicus]
HKENLKVRKIGLAVIMKPEGPVGTSTPSLVPSVKGRPPISRNTVMPSPIYLAEHKEQKSEGSESLTDESSDENSLHTDDFVFPKQILEDEVLEDDRDGVRNISSDCGNQCEHAEEQEMEVVHRKVIKTRRASGTPRMTNTSQTNAQTQKIALNQRSILNIQHLSVCIGVLLILGAFAYNQHNVCIKEPIVDIAQIKQLFPQSNNFWRSIETGVSEIIHFNKPSVIVIIHKNDIRNLTELLGNITMYASCILNENCYVEPIVIHGDDLNTDEMTQDYGIVVDRFRPLLEEKHVMVIRNMDKIHPSVAQAFHSICDEFSPLVKRSLIIFTIQV